MNTHRDMLVALLELTSTGPIDYMLVSKKANVPTKVTEKLLKKLLNQGFIDWKDRVIDVSASQRGRIAIKAIELGSDFESVCRLLKWKEFEGIATFTFQAYGYNVERNYRFKDLNGKRWEVDLVSLRKPTVVLVDCKLWKRNWTKASAIKTMEQHIKRVEAFTNTPKNLLPKLPADLSENSIVIPVVLSLLESLIRSHQGMPIVPILKLRHFINSLPLEMDNLTYFTKNI